MATATQATRRANDAGHRDALLEGAIECLQTVGYARTTARAVVAASNTNLGSIAYHFGSIEKLRDEALIVAATRWLAPVIAAAAEPLGAPDRLERSLRAFLASLDDHRRIALAFLEAVAQVERKPRLRRRLAKAYGELRTVIADTPDPAAQATASLVVAVFDGLMLQAVIDPGRVGDGGRLVTELRPALRKLL